MPAMGRQQLSTAILLEHEEQGSSRYVNLAVSLRLAKGPLGAGIE